MREPSFEEIYKQARFEEERAKLASTVKATGFEYDNAAKPSEEVSPWTGRPTVIGKEPREHADEARNTSTFECRYTSEYNNVNNTTAKSTVEKHRPYVPAVLGTGSGFKGQNLDTSVFIARPLMPSNSVAFGVKIKPDYTSSTMRDYTKPNYERKGLAWSSCGTFGYLFGSMLRQIGFRVEENLPLRRD